MHNPWKRRRTNLHLSSFANAFQNWTNRSFLLVIWIQRCNGESDSPLTKYRSQHAPRVSEKEAIENIVTKRLTWLRGVTTALGQQGEHAKAISARWFCKHCPNLTPFMDRDGEEGQHCFTIQEHNREFLVSHHSTLMLKFSGCLTTSLCWKAKCE